MTVSLGKLVPRAIVVAVVGYCTWPSVSAMISPAEPKPAGKPAERTTAFVPPKMPPPPARDPFLSEAAALLAKEKQAKRSSKGSSPTGKAGPLSAEEVKAVADAATKKPGPQDGKADAGKKKSVKPSNPLSGLRLDATCLVGDAKMAIISGKTYSAGETILATAAAASKLTIVEVLPYKVLLDCNGKTLELAYSDTPSVSRAASAQQRTNTQHKSASGPKPSASKSKQKSKK